ncbi:hypothetical protein ABW19_dt0207077 [Dactylella cylindrospora]|nr:hypothetical protein ABW19_dt0207077 [Dactylella cylindrospora]
MANHKSDNVASSGSSNSADSSSLKSSLLSRSLHLPSWFSSSSSTTPPTPSPPPPESIPQTLISYISRLARTYLPTATMDDLVITVYPYVKNAISTATAITSHLLKIVYPFVNSLYNSNPTVVSLLLLFLAAYYLIKILNRISRIIFTITRNIFNFFIVAGFIIAAMNYYNKRAAGKVMEDGNVIPGFDWDGTMEDFQGVWGLVQNVGGMLMDLLESGSHLEEDGWNSGRRKTVGRKGDPMWTNPDRRAGGKQQRWK